MAITKGTNLFTENFDTNVSVALIDSTGLAYLAYCTGTPPATANLYQHGCIMIQTDAVSGSGAQWENVGTSASPVWASESAAGISSRSASISLSSSQLLNLSGTPVSLIAAPGATSAIILDSLVLNYHKGTAYAAGSALTAVYNGSTASLLSDTIPSAVLIGLSSVTSVSGTTAQLDLHKNKAIELLAIGADYTTGTGTASALVQYRIVTGL